jgi:hypothetical protein
MGKSRTGLEICQRLPLDDIRSDPIRRGLLRLPKSWDAYFVSLGDTPFGRWKKWQPNQPTLLVLDYIVRDYYPAPAREDSANDATLRFDIVRIVAEMTRRAEDLRYPVRLLLLERDFRKEAKAQQKDEELWLDWYKHLEKRAVSVSRWNCRR